MQQRQSPSSSVFRSVLRIVCAPRTREGSLGQAKEKEKERRGEKRKGKEWKGKEREVGSLRAALACLPDCCCAAAVAAAAELIPSIPFHSFLAAPARGRAADNVAPPHLVCCVC